MNGAAPHPNADRMLRAAQAYIRRGWWVFPCKVNKTPLTEHGVKDATGDPVRIRQWWMAHPTASIGVACGPSGLVVIDIDPDKGGFESWAALKAAHDIPDDTLTGITGGGGRHLIYRAPAGCRVKNSAGRLGPGLDVRADGGYIIVPPSGHPTGNVYKWLNPEVLPVDLPESLRLLLEPRQPPPAPVAPLRAPARNGYGAAALQDELEALGCAVEGTRNDTLNRAAFSLGQLVGGGELDRADVAPRLLAAALATGLEEREALATLRSGLAAGMREPRTAPKPAPRTAPATGAAAAPPSATAGAPTAQSAKSRRLKVTSADLVDLLQVAGYHFRLNICDDSLEVNGERMTDVRRAEIRCKLRDAGYGKYLAAAEDAYVAHAAMHSFHPVRDYLQAQTWRREPVIARLSAYFTDEHGVFPTYLRKWLIGAVARAFTGSQNIVLVLDGAQGLGKSEFARWLCPLPGMFADSSINPDDKDDQLRAMQTWVWEVKELGSTIRRADVESLKSFLTCNTFWVRPAYGRHDIRKPGLASFIGTVNNSAGILNDPTGSRRFMITTLTNITWAYREDIDPSQVWAEAYAAYVTGESWMFAADESARVQQVNDEYRVADPIEDFLRKHFSVEPDDLTMWTSTADILTTLQREGLRGHTKALSMDLSATMKRLGCEKRKQHNQSGYFGVGPR